MTERNFIAEAITDYFGPRCPDTEPGCPCCDAWAQYDGLRGEYNKDAAALFERTDTLLRRSKGYLRDALIILFVSAALWVVTLFFVALA